VKYSDYYRHYLELLATGQVTFPCRKTLAEFVAKLVARDYKAHIQTAKFNCIWPDWFLELEQREMSEPSLVEMYVNAFLTDKMAEMDTFWYKLKGMFGRNHNRNKIYFDTVSETELYDFVLKKLSQGDVAHEVFPRNVSYVIEGKTLHRFCWKLSRCRWGYSLLCPHLFILFGKYERWFIFI